jgi:D-sedoheptulose 7-phosphate isomerase
MDDRQYIDNYLAETASIVQTVDRGAITRGVQVLREVKQAGGRLFVLGVGGSAGNASHAVNDFRKIGGMEAYAPTDNVSELTAWTNDSSWDVVFEAWLKGSRVRKGDGLLVLSVGGGSTSTSQNLVRGMDYAKSQGARIVSIVSRDGGHAARISDATVLIPVVSKDRITPHCEGWQGVIWHLLVNALIQPGN